MRVRTVVVVGFFLVLLGFVTGRPAQAQPAAPQAAAGASAAAQAAPPDDPLRALVGRLDLEKYKATIKGLTKFGDRRQGTDRNKAANDWIEAQLKSYGCTPTERITYDYQPAQRATTGQAAQRGATPGAQAGAAQGGARGGSGIKGYRAPTGVNNDPMKQTDVALRELNSQPTTPGPRQQVFCTKVGSTHPEEMYIVSAHMDGIGYAEGANDNGSGSAIVMELARIFSMPDVKTDRSIRFIIWNNEETGLQGARAYIEQRGALQGKENPPGSGKYPEPKWLGVIQHDMMLYDHGMPRADGTLPPEQRPEADVNVEFAGASKMVNDSQALAWALKNANDRYATDYPATVGNRMSNTDSVPFQDIVASVSLREAERLSQVGAGWDPTWHTVLDRYENFSDKDFRLGLNAAQTTLAGVAQLAGAKTEGAKTEGAKK
jgi:Peptidase family M28